MKKSKLAMSIVACAILPLTGCSAAADASLRTLSAKFGENLFADRGHPIDGDLTCKDSASSTAKIVTCTGRDSDHRPVTLKVQIDRAQEESNGHARGTIVGSVDGRQLFRENCIGDKC